MPIMVFKIHRMTSFTKISYPFCSISLTNHSTFSLFSFSLFLPISLNTVTFRSVISVGVNAIVCCVTFRCVCVSIYHFNLIQCWVCDTNALVIYDVVGLGLYVGWSISSLCNKNVVLSVLNEPMTRIRPLRGPMWAIFIGGLKWARTVVWVLTDL